MFNTSLDISNRAVLPPEWSIDDHRSFQLNPLISETFEKAGFVEKFGTGISKIVSACKENGNKIPSFEVTSGGKEMTVEFSASKLYIAIEEYRDNLERKGSFIDYRNVVELMNSGKLHDPDYDPNLATDSMPKNVTLPKSKNIPKQPTATLVWDNKLPPDDEKALIWNDTQRKIYELI